MCGSPDFGAFMLMISRLGYFICFVMFTYVMYSTPRDFVRLLRIKITERLKYWVAPYGVIVVYRMGFSLIVFSLKAVGRLLRDDTRG